MNLLPDINGELAHWPFQSHLTDTSGNGLTLTTLNCFTSAPGGTEQYGTLDACIQGFKFDAGTKLIAPLTSALQLADAFTVQFLILQPSGGLGTQAWFCCADPAGRSGGNGADRIGSLFSFFWGILTPGIHAYWADKAIGSNIPVAGGVWWPGTGTAGWETAAHAIAVRRSAASGGHANLDLFIDGVKQSSTIVIAAPEVPVGVERFYVGGFEGSNTTPVNNALVGDMRILNYGRSDAQLLADAIYAMGPCGSTPTPPVTDPVAGNGTAYNAATMSVAFAADTGRIYRYGAVHVPQLKGNR